MRARHLASWSAVVALAYATEARPCDRAVAPNVVGFTVLPADGARDVPTNVTPFVSGADLELVLLDAQGREIPSTLQDMLVLGEFATQTALRRVLPDLELPPGATVQVRADGAIVSTFTVGDAADVTPPLVEAALAGTAQGARDTTGFSCAYESFARIGVAGEDAAFFVGVKDGAPELGAAVRFDGATSTDELFIFGQGGARVNVAGIDLAGNVSASVPVDVELPELGCASAPSAWPLALLAVAFSSRRSRRGAGCAPRARW
jgi:hypothetical protein